MDDIPYPTNEDYKDDNNAETVPPQPGAEWHQPVIEEKQEENKEEPPAPPPADEEKKRKEHAENDKKMLMELSDLLPEGIAYLNKNVAVPNFKNEVFRKYKPEQVEEYLKQIDNFRNGANVTWTQASREIHRAISDYEQTAQLSDEQKERLKYATKRLIEHYAKKDVEIHPLWAFLLAVGIIEIPILIPVLAPKVKRMFSKEEVTAKAA